MQFARKAKKNLSFIVSFCLLACGGLFAGAVKDSKTGCQIIGKMEKLRVDYDLFDGNHQASISITDAVMGIVVSAVTMGVGAMILSKIFPSITGTDAEANETIATIKSTTWDAMVLLPIALIVFAAVVIIGVVMYLKNSS